MHTLRDTRAVITHCAHHIRGKTLDFGAGGAKYRGIIQQHTTEYTTFDMVAGDTIDVVGDALNPPFEDELFDTIISTQVLEHVERPWVVVSHMKRMLKPGGICIVSAPFLVPYHADPHDFFRYTKQGMESLFLYEGFSIIESNGYGNAPTVLAEMLQFGCFSPYTKVSPVAQWLRDRFMRVVKSGAYVLDTFFRNEVIYANTFVVAQKPSLHHE